MSSKILISGGVGLALGILATFGGIGYFQSNAASADIFSDATRLIKSNVCIDLWNKLMEAYNRWMNNPTVENEQNFFKALRDFQARCTTDRPDIINAIEQVPSDSSGGLTLPPSP